jgi:predicted dehydrogenase
MEKKEKPDIPEKKRIGIVGAGKISGIYLKNLSGMFGKRVILTGITDIIAEQAKQAARSTISAP